MKKLTALAIMAATAVSLSACGSAEEESTQTESAAVSTSKDTAEAAESADEGTAEEGEPVEISFLVTKPEIVTQFEETFSTYMASHPNVTISAIPLSGQTIYEKLTSLYASGNAPTITMVGGPEFTAFSDNFLDITDTKFANLVYDWAKPKTPVDGKVLAVPTTAEGIGILYNKTVIEAATGREFDPASIKNRKDFEAILDEISKTEYSPIQMSNMDWLLGSHLPSVLFGAVSPDYDERQAVIEQCKEGTYDFQNSQVFNEWMDTFDLIMKYNTYKDSPLSNTYEDDQLTMASDEVAFWPIGNFVYPNIIAVNPEAEVGLMPYPMGDADDAYGNKEIVLSYSMFAIDGKQSTPEEQQAAIDFFDWLITSEEGQNCYINTLQFTPVFEGFALEPSNPTAVQLNQYMADGNTLERMSDYFPAGAMNLFGATMQQYLDGVITREDVAAQFAEEWVESAAE